MSLRSVRTVVAVVAVLLTATIPGVVAARDPHAGPAGKCAPALGSRVDFNGDGKSDLAVGAPYATVGGKAGAGAALIAYNGHAGLGANVRIVSQDSPNVKDGAEAGDHFGWSLAAADFDCDGFTDLAVGVPGEDQQGISNVGGVSFLYGSAQGLKGNPSQDIFGFTDGPTQDDAGAEMGTALAALDCVISATNTPGSDGRPDLAVGAPGWFGTGTAIVIYGSFVDGVSPSGGTRGISVTVANGSRVGSSFAAADLDAEATDDLVIGVPNADAAGGSVSNAGAVAVLMDGGQDASVWLTGDELPGTPKANEHLGAAVAAGDLTGDGFGEVAIGVPDRDAGATDAGEVIVVKGTGSGPNVANRVVLKQSTPGVPGDAATGDRFGASIAIGALGHGSRGDLAIGVPGKSVAGKDGAGSVVVLYGGGTLVGTSGNQSWSQASGGVADAPERGDGFGSALSVGEKGGGNPSDLAIGVPREDLASIADAGGVVVLYSAGGPGLAAGDATWFTRASVDVSTLSGKARLGVAVR